MEKGVPEAAVINCASFRYQSERGGLFTTAMSHPYRLSVPKLLRVYRVGRKLKKNIYVKHYFKAKPSLPFNLVSIINLRSCAGSGKDYVALVLV